MIFLVVSLFFWKRAFSSIRDLHPLKQKCTRPTPEKKVLVKKKIYAKKKQCTWLTQRRNATYTCFRIRPMLSSGLVYSASCLCVAVPTLCPWHSRPGLVYDRLHTFVSRSCSTVVKGDCMKATQQGSYGVCRLQITSRVCTSLVASSQPRRRPARSTSTICGRLTSRRWSGTSIPCAMVSVLLRVLVLDPSRICCTKRRKGCLSGSVIVAVGARGSRSCRISRCSTIVPGKTRGSHPHTPLASSSFSEHGTPVFRTFFCTLWSHGFLRF